MKINFKNRYKFYYALGWLALLDIFTKVFFSMGEMGVVQRVILYPCHWLCSESFFLAVYGILQFMVGASLLWFLVGYFSKRALDKNN